MKPLNPDDLVPLNIFTGEFPVEIDPAYAIADHPDNMFGQLYHTGAKIMWAHKDLAAVTLLAALIGQREFGWDTYRLYDCLRPVEAQEEMLKYNFHPLLVTPPGKGAHPRAMAIDIEPFKDGKAANMGTRFDSFTDDPGKWNPAARDHTDFGTQEENTEILNNRTNLEFSVVNAAETLGKPRIYPYPHEWWDYRFEQDIWEQYAPVREADLHSYQRLINPDISGINEILSGSYPKEILPAIDEVRESLRPHK